MWPWAGGPASALPGPHQPLPCPPAPAGGGFSGPQPRPGTCQRQLVGPIPRPGTCLGAAIPCAPARGPARLPPARWGAMSAAVWCGGLVPHLLTPHSDMPRFLAPMCRHLAASPGHITWGPSPHALDKPTSFEAGRRPAIRRCAGPPDLTPTRPNPTRPGLDRTREAARETRRPGPRPPRSPGRTGWTALVIWPRVHRRALWALCRLADAPPRVRSGCMWHRDSQLSMQKFQKLRSVQI